MDLDERERRRTVAVSRVEDLQGAGVVGVAATFTDNSGITRVKAVPLDKLPDLAAWGVGSTPAFDLFNFNDLIAAAPDGSTVVGDHRVIPDLDRLVVLAGRPGWAWAPAERYEQSGEPHAGCSRLLLRRLVDGLGAQGLTVKAAFEIEWVVSAGDGDAFSPAASGPGYGMARLGEASAYSADVLDALGAQGVEVLQYHPEYAPGQFEVSVAAEDPVSAADTSVLVRDTIRAVGESYGFRTSYSPKVAVSGVGNGGHVHLSLWRDGMNLMAGGDRRHGLTGDGEAFTAGILWHLPALMAVGAPSLVSYLRLEPSHWAGIYACWGLENREAAVRLIAGSQDNASWAANVEVKAFDLTANPYLVLGGLIACGSAGMGDGAALPDPVDVDPAALSDDERAAQGIDRLPGSLADSTDLFESDAALAEAFGPAVHGAIVAVRRNEIATFADATPEAIADATRWAH